MRLGKRTLAAVASAALLMSTLRLPAADATCPRVRDGQAAVPPGLQVPDNRVRVIVPGGYCADSTKRYPVLYLLHGVGDTHRSWSEKTDVVAFSSKIDVIIVMPDGGKTPEPGWYSNWFHQPAARDWESFHVRVLVPWVDATFRTLADGRHRAVAGVSMGGLGAMKYAARHPGLFAAAASFSGFVDTMYGWPINGFGHELARPYVGTPDDRVWGDHIEHERNWRAHNPADLAPRLRRTAILLTAGTGTPGGAHGEYVPTPSAPFRPGSYAVENLVFQLNRSFVVSLDRAGVAHADWFYPGGYHGWPYWQAALHWALPRIMETIAPDRA